METTKCNKGDLLAKLETNLVKHKAEYTEAREIWEGKVQTRFKEVLREVSKGNFERTGNPLKDLPKPEEFSKQYEVAIERLKWETDEIVELEEGEFSNYVLDEWAFSHRFAASTQMYNAAR